MTPILEAARCDLFFVDYVIRVLDFVRPSNDRRSPAGAHDTTCAGRVQRLVGRPFECYAARMTIKARVRAGRLVLDEPTDLPEGAEVELLPLDPGDWLDETERAALHQALRESDVDVAENSLVDAEQILRELRSR